MEVPVTHWPFDGRLGGLCHALRPMMTMCGDCRALHFLEEHTVGSLWMNPCFSSYCVSRKIKLPPPSTPPKPLRWLLTSQDRDGKDFRKNIQRYNNALAFTSVGAKIDGDVTQGGNYTYCLQGELYHRMGSLFLEPGQFPKFTQLYFHDTNIELNGRTVHVHDLNRGTLESLQNMLHDYNPYV
jgi:hypothetical protein